ncbi:MAG TPA: sigma-70 family RNA polymerase sigma factor [Burkholderiales bacterium]|nr:sigma-70 family RNA polymerase sigma factor [Burkholderiales bacterium]
MAAADRAEEQDGASNATLGNVLYARKPARLVLETEWTQLVEAVAAGDERALHALYERAHRIVFTLAVRITGDRETAEEVTLDVFHDIWRRASQYSAETGPVIAWIMNQARSRSIDRVRFDHRKKRVEPQQYAAFEEPSAESPYASLELQRNGRDLRNALAVLTPDERTAIETAYFSELTYAEAAARLDQPLGTVKTRIRSALGKLRKTLSGSGEA